ncbi:hypothetical protein ACGFY3_20025 [Streptomyces mirabilis]|uniref:hypothetical protein n=1 Tax=Streptomyces mirabilis TaxID=68239 RepID=UPI0037103F3E
MRDYVRALLGPVGRKNGWQLAEYAGHHTVGCPTPWSAIRCSTLASCPSASATASLASTSLASCPARRALVRLSTSPRHARRRTPIPGSINHHTIEAISTAEPR